MFIKAAAVIAIVAWVSMLGAGNFGLNESYWSFVPAVTAIMLLNGRGK